MDVAVEALATSKACAVTLMWGDQVVPKWVALNDMIHPLSHYALENYDALMSLTSPSMPQNPFVILQRWYAQQFAALLGRLRAAPVGSGTLLDRSVVIWISESGFGDDHTGAFIPVVIAGRAGVASTPGATSRSSRVRSPGRTSSPSRARRAIARRARQPVGHRQLRRP